MIYNVSGIRGKNLIECLPVRTSKKRSYKSMPFTNAYHLFSDMMCLLFSDLIVVPTQATRKVLLSRYPKLSKKVVVIYEGAAKSGKKINLNKPFVFFKTDRALFNEIKEKLRARYPKIPIINIVPNENIEYYDENGARNLDVSLQNIFASARLIVGLPSSELHSTTLLEAMSAKVPVLFSNVGWIKQELSSYPKILINELSSDAVLERIYDIMKNSKNILKETKLASQKLENKYSLDRSLMILRTKFETL